VKNNGESLYFITANTMWWSKNHTWLQEPPAVPPYSCAVMRDGAKQKFQGGRDEDFYHCSNYSCHVVRCFSVLVFASGKLHRKQKRGT